MRRSCSNWTLSYVLYNAKKLAIGVIVIIVMVICAWLLASVLVGGKPSPATTTTAMTPTASTSSIAPTTTRLVRGALCELVAGSGSSDPRERLEEVLTGLSDYAAALSVVAREALVETSLLQDAEILASIASSPYDVSGVLEALNAASSDEDYAAVLDEVRGLALSSKSLGASGPVLSAYALSGCQSRLGLLP